MQPRWLLVGEELALAELELEQQLYKVADMLLLPRQQQHISNLIQLLLQLQFRQCKLLPHKQPTRLHPLSIVSNSKWLRQPITRNSNKERKTYHNNSQLPLRLHTPT